jgi:WD40 repeat protein
LLAVAFSADGTQVAAGGGDVFRPSQPGEVHVWDFGTGEDVLTLRGHTQLVNRVAFLPVGERLVTSSRDGTVKLWQARTGRQVLSLKGGGSYICSMAVSPDGRWIASGNWNNSVTLWEGEAVVDGRAEPPTP